TVKSILHEKENGFAHRLQSKFTEVLIFPVTTKTSSTFLRLKQTETGRLGFCDFEGELRSTSLGSSSRTTAFSTQGNSLVKSRSVPSSLISCNWTFIG